MFVYREFNVLYKKKKICEGFGWQVDRSYEYNVFAFVGHTLANKFIVHVYILSSLQLQVNNNKMQVYLHFEFEL